MGTVNLLHTYITMMGAPLRTGVCFAIWVMVVTRTGAQDDNNPQAPGTAAGFPLPLGGARRYVNGPTSPFQPHSRGFESLKAIGGRIEPGPDGPELLVKGHSYDVDDDTGTRPTMNPTNGHSGGAQMMHAGEVTREWQPPLDRGAPIGQQVSEASSDQPADESPDSYLNGPGENKSSSIPDVNAADWSTNSDQWTYRDEEWAVVRLPDPAYPSLPTPPPPAAALVVVANGTVEVERNVSGLANVTLRYRFYLSDDNGQQDPDAPLPELKVYHVVEGSRNLLQEDKEQGRWQSRTIQVPDADVSSIVFEGSLKGGGDLIALSDVDTGVTPGRDEALDVGDEMMLTSGEPSRTEGLTSSSTTEGNRTQNSPAPEEVPIVTDAEDQDNNTTASASPAATQVGPSLESTTKTSVEGEVEGSNVTETPVDPSELKVSTDKPQNETGTSEQISGSTDVVALNSSMASGDKVTSDDGESDSTTMTGEEGSETDEGELTSTTVTDDEESTPQNSPEAVTTDENTGNSSTVSIPGVTTDSLQTNTSVALPDGTVTEAGGTPVTVEVSGNSSTPSTRTMVTSEGQAVSTNETGGDELTSGTALGPPQTSGAPGSVTSPPSEKISSEGTVPETTSLPSSSGNSTEAVTAMPVSSTSWQVFQVFLVLCVMGLLALGFLYWKRKRRQDDEIPVFTRDANYHNPTFSMEDAANFMSRAGRNTYKTIE